MRKGVEILNKIVLPSLVWSVVCFVLCSIPLQLLGLLLFPQDRSAMWLAAFNLSLCYGCGLLVAYSLTYRKVGDTPGYPPRVLRDTWKDFRSNRAK